MVLKTQTRLDRKWLACELRDLHNEHLLSTLYNTLVQDGELVSPYPSKTYTSQALGKTAYRGRWLLLSICIAIDFIQNILIL